MNNRAADRMFKKAEAALVKSFFSPRGVFCLRNVTVMGLMIGFTAILSRFGTIYITPTFRITFAYLPGAAVAMLFGPWAALVFGFASDFVGYITNPVGAYFPGFAISDMVHYFIYACFFYKRPYKFLPVLIKAVAARLLFVAVIVMGLNYFWMSILTGAVAGSYFTGARLISNLALLPVHALLIAYTCKLLERVKPYIFSHWRGKA
ncbi:MAG: folate family ECF transporter S component [Oscillospiraceae bacterium]|nr:folate family ECF transporter S component [Oscillospiraceae bacterium]